VLGRLLTVTLIAVVPDTFWITPRPAAVQRDTASWSAPSDPGANESEAAKAVAAASGAMIARMVLRGRTIVRPSGNRRRPSARVAAGEGDSEPARLSR